MIELLIIILRWLAELLPVDPWVARRELAPASVRAHLGPSRGGFNPASSPGKVWMTMRLDPIFQTKTLARPECALRPAMRPRSVPRTEA
jgi:hypothetical protein